VLSMVQLGLVCVWSGEEEAFEILLLWLARLDHFRGHDALIGEVGL